MVSHLLPPLLAHFILDLVLSQTCQAPGLRLECFHLHHWAFLLYCIKVSSQRAFPTPSHHLSTPLSCSILPHGSHWYFKLSSTRWEAHWLQGRLCVLCIICCSWELLSGSQTGRIGARHPAAHLNSMAFKETTLRTFKNVLVNYYSLNNNYDD